MGQWDLVIVSIKESDMVLEVIDARVARETRSLKLEELVEKMGKKLIIVINKTDLVSADFEKKIRAELKKEHEIVSVSTKDRKGTGFLKGAIKKYNPKLVCVVGYPNCGKSSIINMLAHTSGAKTSSVPGYTKHAQWIRLSKETKLLDTPGVVPSDEKFSVFTGSVRPEKLKVAEVAAAQLLVKIKDDAEGTNIEEFYKVPLDDVDEFLSALALKRNYLLKGGFDVERAARQVIRDWNTGKLTAWWYDAGRDKDV
ncbi:MAG: GTPase [archaeon]